MEIGIVFFTMLYSLLQLWQFCEAAIIQHVLYLDEILLDDPPCTDRHVSDFRISHLPIWQSYCPTRSL